MKRENLHPWQMWHATVRRAFMTRYVNRCEYRELIFQSDDEAIFDLAENAKDELREYFDDGEVSVIMCNINELREEFTKGETSLAHVFDECEFISRGIPVNEWDVFAMFCNTFAA